jgi:hypothetical protein
MPTLEDPNLGQTLVPDLSSALNVALGAAKERKAEKKEAQKKADIEAEVQVITGDFDDKAKEEARVRLAALAPDVMAAIDSTLKSGDDRAADEAGRIAEQGVRDATVVKKQKTFDQKKDAWRGAVKGMIERGEPQEMIDKAMETLRIFDEDEFDLEMDRMITMGTDIKSLTEEKLEDVKGRPDLQRSSRSGKLTAVPGTVTPEMRFKARKDLEKDARVAGRNTITATEGNETKVLQFNPETKRYDIPVTKTFVKPDQIEFESDGFKVTQQFDQNTGLFKEIARSPVETPKAATDAGKIEQDMANGFLTPEQGKKQQAILAATATEFKSTVGKLIGDQTAAIQVYGEDSEQVKAINAAIKAEQKGEGPKLTDIAGLRKEFTKESGDFVKVRDAINKVRNTNPDSAGDLAMIFNFMKILDPGSTVREGEFANAQNSGGVPERVWALYNNIKDGQRLTPPQRKRFIAQAERTFDSTLETQIQLEESFKGIAERNGIDPRDVIVDFKPQKELPKEGVPVPPGQPEGTSYTGSRTDEGFPIFERPDGSQFALGE